MKQKEEIIIKTIALPKSLYEKLQKIAEADMRNETAEIRYIISKYLEDK